MQNLSSTSLVYKPLPTAAELHFDLLRSQLADIRESSVSVGTEKESSLLATTSRPSRGSERDSVAVIA